MPLDATRCHDRPPIVAGIHGVAWYVTTLAEGLAQAADTDTNAPLTDLLAAAIAHTAATHAGTCDLANPATPAASVGIMRPTADRLDYLLLCDAYLITDDGHNVTAITDPRFARAVADIRREHLNGETAYGSPDHENELRDVARQKQTLTNTTTGYWIAAANPDAAHHAVTASLPLTGDRAIHRAIHRAALLTDGATRAVDTFGLMDWRELLDLLTHHGPHELIHRVRAAERDDPTGETGGQPGHLSHIGQQTGTGMPDHTPPIAADNDLRTQTGSLHQGSASHIWRS